MDRYYDRRVLNFDKWLHPKRIRLCLVLFLILGASFGSGWLVYATGGTKFVYSHTMYIPILMAAFFFRVPGGLMAGIIGGLILGPLMPINVATGEMQAHSQLDVPPGHVQPDRNNCRIIYQNPGYPDWQTGLAFLPSS